ncbi:MAG: hypothetical protein J6W00_05975 [Lentisphaeria bacterium]|nr:hypothetical protein [Lentisphaeria bacterium]
MSRFKKVVSLFLSLVIMCSLAVPAFAAETVMPIPPVIDAEDFVTASGTFTEIDQLGNATYYIQKTDEYTVAIGLYPNVVDCSIKYNTTNLISSAIIPIENVNSIIPQTRNGSKSAQFETIKEAILDGSLPLKEVTLQYMNMQNSPNMRATADEKNRIMSELYDAGWPQAYTNYLRASKTQNGITAKLYHTLSYNIRDYDYTFVIAQTAVSLLMTITGLPSSTLARIVTLALAADGLYKTVKDINVGKFDVFAYENKNVIINDIQPYWAGRTVKWTAITGDIGAALTFDYENRHDDFYDNEGLLDTGLRNYANM